VQKTVGRELLMRHITLVAMRMIIPTSKADRGETLAARLM